ncbi:MAG: PEP-CTERM sorting domain-containing protein [Chthoniobacterales bacterium]|nr:PEP-CTERM sorting domain-containing protein [Chthoniobacterales bacterium]
MDSSDGDIFAYNFSTASWSTFLSSSLPGDASQLEFHTDGRVFLSRTISNQPRIYSYTLNTPGDYSSGLNPSSQTLIGSYGSTGTATGIRIGPDGRLYANAFNSGEIWRSNPTITAMESSPFLSGINSPGSLFFAPIPEPSSALLLSLLLATLLLPRRKPLKIRTNPSPQPPQN